MYIARSPSKDHALSVVSTMWTTFHIVPSADGTSPEMMGPELGLGSGAEGDMGATSETQAMARALALARRGPVGINPRVGCVILDAAGDVVGEGHDGAGSLHAEVVAVHAARERARGGTAVTTLEPCTHWGRTAPCVDALVAAGMARVVYGFADPNPVAGGGAAALVGAGVETRLVDDRALRVDCEALVARWAFGIATGRPFVTWKFAATLDGRSAAPDGSSRWIAGAQARADVHAQRAERDTVLVGTGTVLVDDPQLTVRESRPPCSVADSQPLPTSASTASAASRGWILSTSP